MENQLYQNVIVPVYVINLSERTDRLAHMQFTGKDDFDVTVVEACKHEVGAIGLWGSIKKAARLAIEQEEDVIIICEDDHAFTQHYSKDRLFHHIVEAAGQGVSILLGGISSFGQAIPVSEGRFWVDQFEATQFTIVYRSFFQQILDESFTDGDAAGMKLSHMTSHKMVMHPFISIRHDFGFSDLPTKGAATPEYLKLFDRSDKRLAKIQTVAGAYGSAS